MKPAVFKGELHRPIRCQTLAADDVLRQDQGFNQGETELLAPISFQLPTGACTLSPAQRLCEQGSSLLTRTGRRRFLER